MNPFELTDLATLILISQFPKRGLRHLQQLRDLFSFKTISRKFLDEIVPGVLSLIESLSEEVMRKINQSKIGQFSGLRKLVIFDYLGDLVNFRNLEALEFHSRDYSDLDLRKMFNLKSLWLSMVKRPQHMGLLETLTTLTKLDLGGCNSKKFMLPDSFIKVETIIQRMTRIENLKLSYCNIIHDQHLLYLTNLKTLNLTKCTTVTNEALSRLTTLTDLTIRENSIINNECIGQLTGLKHLDIQSNVTITTKGLHTLTNLEVLLINAQNSLNSNELEKCNFKLLRKLTFQYELCSDGLLKNLPSLVSLDMEARAIMYERDPPALWLLPKLETLGLEQMFLTDPDFTPLHHLTSLSIRNTNITSEAIKHCTSLTSLTSNMFLQYETYKGMPNLRTLLSPVDIMDSLRDEPLTSLTHLSCECNRKLDTTHFQGLPLLRSVSLVYVGHKPIKKDLGQELDRRWIKHRCDVGYL